MNEIAIFLLWCIFFIFVGFGLNWIIRKGWSWGKTFSPTLNLAKPGLDIVELPEPKEELHRAAHVSRPKGFNVWFDWIAGKNYDE